jgi:hypothetical protein
MAKRSKQSAAEAVQLTPETLTPPQLAEIVSPPPPEAPKLSSQQADADQPTRQWRANPFPLRTVNLGGYKVQLQESRPEKDRPSTQNNPSLPQKKTRWEMQIKFGSGSKDDMPSDAVRDFIKSHKLDVVTRDGEEKQVQLFAWNDKDRAWGMEIDYNQPKASRDKAHRVFDEVVELVTQERGVGPQR